MQIQVQARPNHSDSNWARQAIVDYKLKGFNPSVTSKKKLTKLQVATVAFATCLKLLEITDRIGKKIEILEAAVNNAKDSDSPESVQKLRDRVQDLKDDMAGLKSTGTYVRQLRTMMKRFHPEFKLLGVDEKWMSQLLMDIDSRTAKLDQPMPEKGQ